MLRKYLYGIGAFGLAFAILSVSIVQTSNSIFAFSTPKPSPLISQKEPINRDINLPDPGNILPGEFLWPVVAMEDRVNFLAARKHQEKSELALKLGNKRLAAAQIIFAKGNNKLGKTIIEKAEKYLEIANNEEKLARGQGDNTVGLLTDLSNFALVHRRLCEDLGENSNIARTVYRDASQTLLALGFDIPKSPFLSL